MFSYIWPIVLVVFSNVLYQICAKSVPQNMHSLAALTITYVIGAVVSVVLYYILGKDANLLNEFRQVNWAPFVLGLVIVGLEVGYIYAFKAGWHIGTTQIVQAVLVTVILVFIGHGLYHETITIKKIAGVAVCLGGLFLINT